MAAAVSNTVYGIICDAMKDAGYLQLGEDPNSEQLAEYMRRLCDIVNLWQTQGIKLFLIEEQTLAMVAGQQAYQLASPQTTPPAKHLRVLAGRVVDADGVTVRPLTSMSWEEWNRIPSGQSGPVVRYFVDKTVDALNVKLWNVPDTAEVLNELIFTVHRQIVNPINLLEDMQFPQEWRIALRWGLANDICTGQPKEIMDRCEKFANIYRTALEDWDVEDTSTTFEVDTQGYGGGGSFR